MAETSMPRAGMASAEEILAPSPGALLRRRIFHHWGLVIGGTILVIIVLMALLAPLIAPHDPYDQQLARKLIPPIWSASAKATWAHPLGTDHLGRDYLTRLLYGAQISLLIGVSAMLISGLIGTTLGVLAGYFGGRIDMVVNFIVTTRLSMPVVLVALAVVSLIGSSLSVVIWVLGLLIWDRFAVVMRSATQQVRSREFIVAAQAVGCSTPRILLTEIAPNVLNHLIVVATLEMAHAILLEAALSFLGLGVQPPTPSWGLMISEAKGLMFFDAWLISIPGIALFLLVSPSTSSATACATSPRRKIGIEACDADRSHRVAMPPSPLVGEGRGGGEPMTVVGPPTPNPSPPGGGGFRSAGAG